MHPVGTVMEHAVTVQHAPVGIGHGFGAVQEGAPFQVSGSVQLDWSRGMHAPVEGVQQDAVGDAAAHLAIRRSAAVGWYAGRNWGTFDTGECR